MKIKTLVPFVLFSTCLTACNQKVSFEEASQYMEKVNERFETINKFKYVQTI